MYSIEISHVKVLKIGRSEEDSPRNGTKAKPQRNGVCALLLT